MCLKKINIKKCIIYNHLVLVFMSISEQLRQKIQLRMLGLFEKAHNNDDIMNLDIKQNILDKLLPHQTLHTFNMITAIKNNIVVFDGSYTGTGKTYTTAATCAQVNLIPFVICTKSIISIWKNVLELFGLEYVAVINYESIRSLKYNDDAGKKVSCPYIRKIEGRFEWDFTSHPKKDKIVIIFDEVHKCKNQKSLNGRLLLSCRNRKTMMLSATLCDKKSDFGIFGMMLGFYKRYNQGKKWMESIIREDKNSYNKVNTLHEYLFPEKGSRMALDDLGECFPMNQISFEFHNLDRDSVIKINRYYEQLKQEVKNYKGNLIDDYIEHSSPLTVKCQEKTEDICNIDTKQKNILSIITDIRQRIENLKVNIMFDLLQSYYEQHKSVVIFVNYVSSHNIITALIKNNDIDYAELNGKQDIDERAINIDRFQNNEVRVMVCMAQMTGISLHDVSGRFPRVSIISPCFSDRELVQVLGRIYRAGIKSPCLQKIIFCADTIEEHIAKILAEKKLTLDKITGENLDILHYSQSDDNINKKETSSKKIPKNNSGCNTNKIVKDKCIEEIKSKKIIKEQTNFIM